MTAEEKNAYELKLAEEKNAYELELVQLKSKFIKIGVTKMPMEYVLDHLPKNLNQKEAIKWRDVASNVWNGRSTAYKKYLPIFERVYNELLDTEVV